LGLPRTIEALSSSDMHVTTFSPFTKRVVFFLSPYQEIAGVVSSNKRRSASSAVLDSSW